MAETAAAFAQAAAWPLLADPLSGARRGKSAIAHYDALLRDETFAASVEPDLVLRVGDLPVSKPLRSWLSGLGGVRQAALDPEAAWQDPASVVADSLALDPAAALSQLSSWLAGEDGQHARTPEDWLGAWRSADERAAQAILKALAEDELSEPAVAAELGVLLPAQSTLFVASSMPVRDIETFWPVRPDPPRVLCNRGANGIDGTVSSAFGAAAHDPGPVVLLIGDVALAHDIGGLLAARRLGLKLTIVLLDNGGGGIFDFLAVSRASMALAPDAHGGGPGRAKATGMRTTARTSTRAMSPLPRAWSSRVRQRCTAWRTSGWRRSRHSAPRWSKRSRRVRARQSCMRRPTVRTTWSCTAACGARCRTPRQARKPCRVAG